MQTGAVSWALPIKRNGLAANLSPEELPALREVVAVTVRDLGPSRLPMGIFASPLNGGKSWLRWKLYEPAHQIPEPSTRHSEKCFVKALLAIPG